MWEDKEQKNASKIYVRSNTGHSKSAEVFDSRKTRFEALNFSLALDSKTSFIMESIRYLKLDGPKEKRYYVVGAASLLQVKQHAGRHYS